MKTAQIEQAVNGEFKRQVEELQEALNVIDKCAGSVLEYELISNKQAQLTAEFKVAILEEELKKRKVR